MEELNCDTAFTIPLFGGIKISESVAVTWIIMAVVVLLCVIFVRNLSVENPGKAQLLLESAIGKGVDFFEDVMCRTLLSRIVLKDTVVHRNICSIMHKHEHHILFHASIRLSLTGIMK